MEGAVYAAIAELNQVCSKYTSTCNVFIYTTFNYSHIYAHMQNPLDTQPLRTGADLVTCDALNAIKMAFPQAASENEIKCAKDEFNEMMSKESLSQGCCAVCADADKQWRFAGNKRVPNFQHVKAVKFADKFKTTLCRRKYLREPKFLSAFTYADEFAMCNGMVLEEAGLVLKNGPGKKASQQPYVQVCSTCYTALHSSKKTCPVNALANNLWTGVTGMEGKGIPELDQLTDMEKLCIAQYRVYSKVMKLTYKGALVAKDCTAPGTINVHI
jgi:hypothetical protein